jgi:hypothetical protein
MTLSARFGISDVALKKTCARAGIRTLERGYWAKREAGKKTFQAALPLRAPGMEDEVFVAGGNNYWYQDWKKKELLRPLPPPPEFAEPIEAVRERIAKIIGKVTVHEMFAHGTLQLIVFSRKMTRAEKSNLPPPDPISGDNPPFDAPFERRRLRILNNLFFAVARMNDKPTFFGGEARVFCLSFYRQHIHMKLDQPKQPNRRAETTASPKSNDAKLSLSILKGPNSETAEMAWQDDDGGKLEEQLTEIAIQLVLTAEIKCRERAIRQYQWRIERKADSKRKSNSKSWQPSAQGKNGKNGSSRLESIAFSRMRQHFSKPAR